MYLYVLNTYLEKPESGFGYRNPIGGSPTR